MGMVHAQGGPAPAFCPLGPCSLTLGPEPSLPFLVERGGAHHSSPTATSNPLGLAGGQNKGDALQGHCSPASQEGAVSIGRREARTSTSPLAFAKLAVRGELLPRGGWLGKHGGNGAETGRTAHHSDRLPLLHPHGSAPAAQPPGPRHPVGTQLPGAVHKSASVPPSPCEKPHPRRGAGGRSLRLCLPASLGLRTIVPFYSWGS